MTQPAKDSLSHDPLINETVGNRYVIEKLIGRGGVGLVYLATDKQQPARKVVVKVLAPHWAEDADAVARFDREAQRMAKLDHPNVVRMFAHGHHGSATYIVMEFLDGEPLRRYLNRTGPLPFDQFIPIASQILAGVGYVHARDTMLRDIKPPNIMLCERDGKANHVKLLDFGLAKLIEEENEITKAHVIGTAGYLAPEQIKGEPIDVRVDVYALGILFFIMLTGESPIVGENDGAILFNHVHGKPKQLRDLLPEGHGVPDSCIELVHQCLSKDPADRPQDANEMAEVLFETVHPSLFVLPDASEQTRRPAREYWAERMKRGANAVSLDDEDDNLHTNPVKKRTLEEVRQAAKVEEEDEEITGEHALVQRSAKPASKPAQRPASSARGKSGQPGSRPRKIPPPPPPPPGRLRSGKVSAVPTPRAAAPKMPPPPNKPGVKPMGTPPGGAPRPVPPTAVGPSADETLTGMPTVKPSELDALPGPEPHADAIKRKQTIMGIPRPKPEPGVPEPVPTRGRPAPEVVIPTLAAPGAGAPDAAMRPGGSRIGGRKAGVPTIGTAALKANTTRRRRGSSASPMPAANDGVNQDEARRAGNTPPPGLTQPPTQTEPRNRQLEPPRGLTMPPPSTSGPHAPVGTPPSGPNALLEPPKGRTVAMDAEEVKRAAVAGSGPMSGPNKPLGGELFEEDAAAAARLLGSAPMEPLEQPSNTRFSLLLVVGGITALALGVLTAWLVLDGGGNDDKTEVAAADGDKKGEAKPEASPDPAATAEPAADGGPTKTIVVQADPTDKPKTTKTPEPEPEPESAPEPEAAGDGGDDGEAAAAVGTIDVQAMPSAHVSIDGEDQGNAPFKGELSVGRHEVRVTAAGFQTWKQTVEIAAGETQELHPSLKRKSGGGGKKSDGGSSTKEDPPPPTPPKEDPPPKKDKPPKKDVFMNTDGGKPSGGIFLPVGKDK